MLEWIADRVDGRGAAQETPIGNLPTSDSLDLAGLDIPAEDLTELLTVDIEAWKAEAANLSEYYDSFGDRLPATLRSQLAALQERLNKAQS